MSNRSARFEPVQRIVEDDGWGSLEALAPFKTTVTVERPKTIITRNESPDLSFDRSINPYRGCEHGCVYCFARPTHAYMGLSSGLDFESRLFVKLGAAERLEAEGVSARVVNLRSLAPLDEASVLDAARTGALVTVEEAHVSGGLGGAVCELVAAHDPVPVERVGFPGFLPTGSVDWLFKRFGLSAEGIAAAARRAVARRR